MLTFLRVCKFAVQDIIRNISLSLMTILILILMLLSVNTLFIIRFLTIEATHTIKDQIDVSVFFSHTATEAQITEVKNYINSFPEVTELKEQSREEVLNQFKEQYKDNPDIVASIEELGENPLGPTMIVKTRRPDDYHKIIKSLDVPEYQRVVVAKTFANSEQAIARINTITTQVEKFSIALTTLFAIIAFLIIFNTIRVAIYTHRIEISIKRLVGATNWFIRTPYIIESFIFTFISIGITMLLLFLATRFLDPFIAVLFDKSSLLTNYYISNIIMLFGLQFLAVLVLTVVSSSLAMRRHLRV